MSMTQLAIGSVATATILSAALGIVLPGVDPIKINSLTYANGIVTQDRTVNTTADFFFMRWSAAVVDVTTGRVVCNGSGDWNYPAGRIAVELPLSEWVGEECAPPPGEYKLRASWLWGDGQVGAQSVAFRL